MTVTSREDNEEFERKQLMFFGVDLLKMPCLRSSLLNGYAGAFVGAICGFLFTSKPRIASHAALASFWIATLPTWVICRYRRFVNEIEWKKFQNSINENIDFSKDEYHLPKELRESEENEKAIPGKKS